jgi:hypothetical protein
MQLTALKNSLLNHAATLLLFRSILIEGMYDSPTDARACKPVTEPDNILALQTGRPTMRQLSFDVVNAVFLRIAIEIAISLIRLCAKSGPSVNKEGIFEFYMLAA